MTVFLIDGEEFDIDELGPDAEQCANRMTELQSENDAIKVRETENLALLNFYAMTIKSIANPEPKIEIVK